MNTIRYGGWGKLVLIASIILMLCGGANAAYSTTYAPLEDTYVRCTTNPGWTLQAGNLTTLLIGNVTNTPVARAYLKYSVNTSRTYTLTCADNNGFNALIPVPTLYYLPASSGEFFEVNTTFVNQPCNSSCTMAGNTLAGMRYAQNGCPDLETIGDMGHGKFTYGGNDYNNFTRNVYLNAHTTYQYVLAWQTGNQAPWYSDSIYSKESAIPMPCTLSIAGCQYPSDCAGVEGGEFCNQDENTCDVNNVLIFNHTFSDVGGEWCNAILYRNTSVINASGEGGGTGLNSYLYRMGENDTEYSYVASEIYPMETQPYGLMYDCGIGNTSGYKYYVEVRDNGTFNYQLGQSNEYTILPDYLTGVLIINGVAYYGWTSTPIPYAVITFKNMQTSETANTTAWINGHYSFIVPPELLSGSEYQISTRFTEGSTSYAGYSIFSKPISGNTINMDVRAFPLTSSVYYYGRVTQGGVGAANASVTLSGVTLVGLQPRVYTINTLDDGSFNATITQGVYTRVASKGGVSVIGLPTPLIITSGTYEIFALPTAIFNVTINITVVNGAFNPLSGVNVKLQDCTTYSTCPTIQEGISNSSGTVIFKRQYMTNPNKQYKIVGTNGSNLLQSEVTFMVDQNYESVTLPMQNIGSRNLRIWVKNSCNNTLLPNITILNAVAIGKSCILCDEDRNEPFSGRTDASGYANFSFPFFITYFEYDVYDLNGVYQPEHISYQVFPTNYYSNQESGVSLTPNNGCNANNLFSISGNVMDDGGFAVVSIDVKAHCVGSGYEIDRRAVTNGAFAGNGSYTIEGIPYGSMCTIQTYSNWHENQHISRYVDGNINQSFTLQRLSTGLSIFITVKSGADDDTFGKPIDRATFGYRYTGSNTSCTKTYGTTYSIADGTASFNDLCRGSYNFTLSKLNYNPYSFVWNLQHDYIKVIYLDSSTQKYTISGLVYTQSNNIKIPSSGRVYFYKNNALFSSVVAESDGNFFKTLDAGVYTVKAASLDQTMSSNTKTVDISSGNYTNLELMLIPGQPNEPGVPTTIPAVHPPGAEYSDDEMIYWLRVNIFPIFQTLLIFFVLGCMAKAFK